MTNSSRVTDKRSLVDIFLVVYKPALHGIFAYVEERGKEKVEKWALMQEPASTW